MRTIWVIFVLALITVTGEIYADAVMTSSLISPAAPDPVTVAIGLAIACSAWVDAVAARSGW